MTGNGADYRGCQTKTKGGYTCKAWNSNTPIETPSSKISESYGTIGQHSYCRNPDNEPTIWCYTTDPNKRFDFCDTLRCDESFSGKGADYRGC